MVWRVFSKLFSRDKMLETAGLIFLLLHRLLMREEMTKGNVAWGFEVERKGSLSTRCAVRCASRDLSRRPSLGRG